MAWSCQRGVVWDSVIGVDLRAAPAARGGSALLTRKPWRVSVVQMLSAGGGALTDGPAGPVPGTGTHQPA